MSLFTKKETTQLKEVFELAISELRTQIGSCPAPKSEVYADYIKAAEKDIENIRALELKMLRILATYAAKVPQ